MTSSCRRCKASPVTGSNSPSLWLAAAGVLAIASLGCGVDSREVGVAQGGADAGSGGARTQGGAAGAQGGGSEPGGAAGNGGEPFGGAGGSEVVGQGGSVNPADSGATSPDAGEEPVTAAWHPSRKSCASLPPAKRW
jgi:hypothetical protein